MSKLTDIKMMSPLRKSSSGFTLIELMVAMVIGMVVMGAGIGLLKSAASQNRMVSNTAFLQEDAFFLSHVVKQQIAQIGYRPIDPSRIDDATMPFDSLEEAFPAVGANWEEGQTLKIEGDALSYRFYGASRDNGTPDLSIYDCQGNPIGAGDSVENQISLENNKLSCTIGSETEVMFGSDDATTIESIVYELGIDDDENGTVDRYIDAATANTADFLNTRQLNMKVLFATQDNVAANYQTYNFDGEEVTATDKKLRLESEFIMQIRNL